MTTSRSRLCVTTFSTLAAGAAPLPGCMESVVMVHGEQAILSLGWPCTSQRTLSCAAPAPRSQHFSLSLTDESDANGPEAEVSRPNPGPTHHQLGSQILSCSSCCLNIDVRLCLGSCRCCQLGCNRLCRSKSVRSHHSSLNKQAWIHRGRGSWGTRPHVPLASLGWLFHFLKLFTLHVGCCGGAKTLWGCLNFPTLGRSCVLPCLKAS